MKQNKKKFKDDGRTIAPMNVDGMPWYNPNANKNKPTDENQTISKKETRRWIFNGILVAVFLGLLFIGAAWLFIMFCTTIWLK